MPRWARKKKGGSARPAMRVQTELDLLDGPVPATRAGQKASRGLPDGRERGAYRRKLPTVSAFSTGHDVDTSEEAATAEFSEKTISARRKGRARALGPVQARGRDYV